MSRTFLYARVSTPDQTTDNQVLEIEAAGFSVNTRRVVTECISGSTAAGARPQFAKLIDRMEPGDVLIVTKLDRLGRNAMDVRSTVERLAGDGIKVYCLALGGMDLTSATGKMTMGVIAAVAEFEKDQLIERTNAGLARAVAQGKKLGRRAALSEKKRAEVLEQLKAGASVSSLARAYGISRQTIMRIRSREGEMNLRTDVTSSCRIQQT
ncbi:recombinase family protein [Pseudomonas sp. MAG002Y]|uniref:recombinase family protein n=1 Tax=Pseudomonas sp. MAG002Y TaxID=2678690 RepID=UPI001C60E58D|nr:recombinase family protein [Pseudomonas sp. MAG002Y]MBW5416306.1 helix-turn-helix domain-containing protein [Pseudomonas sp. MAG002Y]